ncbi:MAG: DegT/DnrJ/EryC1/StrS family aminotransferase [Nitrospiraceae bacterium]
MKVQTTLPPTAAPIPAAALAAGLRGLLGASGDAATIRRELQTWLQADYVDLVSSGKAALAIILGALASAAPKRRRVIIPAYTCYSVPSAVVKAGLDVVPCDVDPLTLDFRPDVLERLVDQQTLAVLATHLFGNPSAIDRAVTVAHARGALVIEDAAQAMGAESNGRVIGTIGDVGFFSLGRGKNLSCGGGGVIVSRQPKVSELLGRFAASLETESWTTAAQVWAESFVTSVLIHPGVYWLPAGLPFLGLGETKFYTDFPVTRMADARVSLLAGWRSRLEEDNRIRRGHAAELIQLLRQHAPESQVVMGANSIGLRLPVLLKDRAMKQALLRIGSERGLGISQAYPGTIPDVKELQGRVSGVADAGARAVVERMVTLPTHRYVTRAQRLAIAESIGQLYAEGRRQGVANDVGGLGTTRTVGKASGAASSKPGDGVAKVGALHG